jgi:hypothetical protein
MIAPRDSKIVRQLNSRLPVFVGMGLRAAKRESSGNSQIDVLGIVGIDGDPDIRSAEIGRCDPLYRLTVPPGAERIDDVRTEEIRIADGQRLEEIVP